VGRLASGDRNRFGANNDFEVAGRKSQEYFIVSFCHCSSLSAANTILCIMRIQPAKTGGPTDGRSRQRSQSGDDSYADCKKENRIFAHEKSHFPSVANLC
jgi:hypothetical protein